MFARSLRITALAGAVSTLALPTVTVARPTELAAALADTLRTAPVNTFVHERNLADDISRDITMPNNDTMYSNAFLDLREGPLTIGVQAMGTKRYFSVALMDAWTNNFAYFGTRATGDKAVEVTLIGPDGVATAGAAVISAQTGTHRGGLASARTRAGRKLAPTLLTFSG